MSWPGTVWLSWRVILLSGWERKQTQRFAQCCKNPVWEDVPFPVGGCFLAEGHDPALAGTSRVCLPCERDIKTPIIPDNPISGAH